MIDRGKVITALQDKEQKFQEFVATRDKQQFALAEQLAQFLRYDYQAICNALAERGLAWPGALPTPELDAAHALCMPFAAEWQNHQEARVWAMQVLRNRTVAAVDGSQITPTGEYSVPIGAMQIGWFVNEHREGGSYEKDVYFEVMAPQEVVDDESTNMESGQPDRRVNQLRFMSECQKLCEIMVRSEHLPALEKPLCFFDGSFIISFAGQMRPQLAEPYVRTIIELLDCSKRTRVPLVGFVDDSHSRDLVTLMGHITQRHDGRATGDAAMLHRHLPAAWVCAAPFCLRPRRWA
ncbi:MAG: DNA double-strand break repair nuclease NurA [Caldilineaceae bacterium]